MSAVVSVTDPSDAPRDDQVVVLSGATWTDYQRLLEMRGESAVPRITYQKGVLQIMSPSSRHERVKSVLNLLVTVYCLETGIEFTPFGAWTLEDEDGERGLEPDECYILGPRRDATRPDLAIEVVLTSGTIRKLDVYRALGVPEVWFWQRGTLVAHVLGENGYEARATSDALPGIDLEELAELLERPIAASAVMRAYRDALRAR